jgi:hypothetical protein
MAMVGARRPAILARLHLPTEGGDLDHLGAELHAGEMEAATNDQQFRNSFLT